jgi:hypothetical protein
LEKEEKSLLNRGWPHLFPQLEPQLKTDGLTPVEMQNLEPGTCYQVSGRCQVENGYPWGEWSSPLSFQTPFLGEDSSTCLALLGLSPPPPQARQSCSSNFTCLFSSSSDPEDVWVSGTVCETSGKRAALLVWKVSLMTKGAWELISSNGFLCCPLEVFSRIAELS